MILWIDACARVQSRTRVLAEHLLGKMGEVPVRVPLYELNLSGLTEEETLHRDDRLARQFAAADEVVVAAPYWDLSFPSVLKNYVEHICVNGITFRYSEQGIPVGLCRAKRLFYVSAAGGPVFQPVFGYGYIETLAKVMFGIPECYFFKAENLDIAGNDADDILRGAMNEMDHELNSAGIFHSQN